MASWRDFADRVVLITAGAIVTSSLVSVKPSQAAEFDFSLQDTVEPLFFGQGSLSFTKSNLTGVGQETATLSDLPGASLNLFYQSGQPTVSGTFHPVDISSFTFSPSSTFYFNNGDLVGINLTAIANNVSVTYSPCEDSGNPNCDIGEVEFNGTDRLTITKDNQYTNNLDGYYTVLNTGETNSSNEDTGGNVSITTVVPVTPSTPVPEPSSTLGAIAALGLGVVGQRVGTKRQRRQTVDSKL